MSDLRRQLMDGRVDLHRVGAVTAATGTLPPFVVVDGAGVEVVERPGDVGGRLSWF
jgi:hypothetical protein